jgi:type IV pilus assembly PilX-like protein
MTITSRFNARLADERGTALIIALMAMMLLTALGAAVVMVSNTETHIAANYRNSQEALYAADAAVERVVQDLLLVPRWNDILAGSAQSGFVDGAMTAPKALPGGGQVTLCCGANTATGQLQTDTDTLNLWGANNPQWKLFAWGPLGDMLPYQQIDSPMYVAVWVADDPADGVPGANGIVGAADGNPLVDANGTLTLHAEAIGPSGTRKVIEVTVARTSSTEIERGQIAQRGQEELNQRARKAAVQTPGKSLSNMRMNNTTGNLIVQ